MTTFIVMLGPPGVGKGTPPQMTVYDLRPPPVFRMRCSTSRWGKPLTSRAPLLTVFRLQPNTRPI